MADPIYRTTDLTRWGVGKLSNLTATEGDRNLWELLLRIVALEGDRPEPNEISQVQQDGLQITFILADGAELGPIDLPTLKWRWRGDWLPSTIYATLDTFKVDDQGLFVVLVDHTSDTTFDPDATTSGSPDNPLYFQLLGVGTLTQLTDLVGVSISSPLAGDLLVYDGNDWVNGSEPYRLITATEGGSVLLNPEDRIAVLNPAADLAAYTITFPAGADKRRIRLSTRKTITALTISGNGGEEVDWLDGSPADNELAQFQSIEFMFVSSLATWVAV